MTIVTVGTGEEGKGYIAHFSEHLIYDYFKEELKKYGAVLKKNVSTNISRIVFEIISSASKKPDKTYANILRDSVKKLQINITDEDIENEKLVLINEYETEKNHACIKKLSEEIIKERFYFENKKNDLFGSKKLIEDINKKAVIKFFEDNYLIEDNVFEEYIGKGLEPYKKEDTSINEKYFELYHGSVPNFLNLKNRYYDLEGIFYGKEDKYYSNLSIYIPVYMEYESVKKYIGKIENTGSLNSVKSSFLNNFSKCIEEYIYKILFINRHKFKIYRGFVTPVFFEGNTCVIGLTIINNSTSMDEIKKEILKPTEELFEELQKDREKGFFIKEKNYDEFIDMLKELFNNNTLITLKI